MNAPTALRTLTAADLADYPTLYVGDRILVAEGGWVQIEEITIKVGRTPEALVDHFWTSPEGNTGRDLATLAIFLKTYGA